MSVARCVVSYLQFLTVGSVILGGSSVLICRAMRCIRWLQLVDIECVFPVQLQQGGI